VLSVLACSPLWLPNVRAWLFLIAKPVAESVQLSFKKIQQSYFNMLLIIFTLKVGDLRQISSFAESFQLLY
jgi:hypothetical protein